MKKTLLIICALSMISLSAFSARLDLSLANMGSGWDSSYDPATKTITFDGEWKGRGWWLGDVDYSSYDHVVIKFNPTDSRLQVVIEYNNSIPSTTVGVDAGLTTITATLDPVGKASVKQIYLQKSTAGTVTLIEAYLEGDAPLPNYELSLASLGAGWESSYDAASKTITYDGDWKGRGWWLDGADFSAYKDVVIDFIATDKTIKLVVEYGDGTAAPDAYANAGATTIKVDLDAAKSKNVKQIYLQRENAGTLVLVSAYLTPLPTGIENQRPFNVFYSRNELNLNNPGSIQVFDINGRLIVSREKVSTVDLSYISLGVYIAKAVVEGKTEIIKFVK